MVQGCTLVHLALGGRYAGFTALADDLRADAAAVAGALVHNAGSVLVIILSALLLHWQQKTA